MKGNPVSNLFFHHFTTLNRKKVSFSQILQKWLQKRHYTSPKKNFEEQRFCLKKVYFYVNLRTLSRKKLWICGRDISAELSTLHSRSSDEPFDEGKIKWAKNNSLSIPNFQQKKIENPAKNFWQDCQDCFLPLWRKVLGKWKCCFIRQFNLAFPVFHQTYLCLLACFSLEGCQLYSECPEGSFWEKLSFRNFFHHYGTMCNIPSKVFSKLLFCVQRHRWLDSLWKTNIFDFSSFWCRSCFTFSWNYSEQ